VVWFGYNSHLSSREGGDLFVSRPVAEFIGPDWGDIVNSGKVLTYRPAMLHGLAGRYDNPMLEFTLSPSQRSMNSATGNYLPLFSRWGVDRCLYYVTMCKSIVYVADSIQ
jgi:hypothetical protein